MKRIFFLILAAMLSFATNNSNKNIIVNSKKQVNEFNASVNPSQYIGYGYDITKGKTISETDSLNLNYPILDISSENVLKKTKVFSSSQTIYYSDTSSYASQISKKMASNISANLGVSANIYKFSMELSTQFDLTKNESWDKVATESYSYYSIYVRNKPVILQMSDEELRQNLSYNFKNDLQKVKSNEDAKSIFDKYGTHLLTGYTLGGIFSMTNYFATCSDSYVRENSTSFNAQVSAGMSSIGGTNSGFSFNDSYGSKDNNSYAVNNYKCITYGGDTFPGLTMDQAFKYYETFGKAGYIYDIWTNSINEGKNLVIVDIPQNSRLVPLWDLLPSGDSYTTARGCLLDYYINTLQKSSNEYGVKYPDVYGKSTNHVNDGTLNPTIDFSGYNVSRFDADNKTKNMYFSLTDNNKGVLYKNSLMSFDVNSSTALNGERSIIRDDNKENTCIKILDKKNGLFRVNGENSLLDTSPHKYYFIYKLGEKVMFSKAFQFQNGSYSGGDGSTESPYLISSYSDLKTLADTPSDYGKNFKLLNDIEFSGEWNKTIGTFANPFTGAFDGNNFSIKNLILDFNAKDTYVYGLFGVNRGVIKNLNIENESSVYDDYSLTNKQVYIGGVCAYNQGTIDNANVDKANLFVSKIKLWSENSFNSDIFYTDQGSFLTSGLICGLNIATIKNCNVTESSLIMAEVNKSQNVSGGLVGTNYSNDSLVENCSVKKVKIATYAGNKFLDIPIRAISGGLVGVAYNGTINNCVVMGLNTDLTLKDLAPYKVTNLNNIDEFLTKKETWSIFSGCCAIENSRKLLSVSGGILGCGFYNSMLCFEYGKYSNPLSKQNESCKLSSCAIIDVKSGSILSKVYNITDSALRGDYQRGAFVDNLYGLKSGFFFGHLENKGKLSNIESIDVKHERVTDLLNINDFQNDYKDAKWYKIGLTKESWKGNGFDSFLDDSVWDIEKDNYPQPYKKTLLGDETIKFDFTNAKKTFYQGESFVPGNIQVTASPAWSDSEIVIDNFDIDYSGFDSTMPGTALIKVSCYGIEDTYIVNILSNDMTGVIVEQAKDDFFEYDKIEPSDFLFNKVYANGTKEQIPSTNIKFNISTFEEGTNSVTATIYEKNNEKLTQTFNVIAKKRDVKRVIIAKKPIRLDYSIGVSTIDTIGLEVNFDFEDGFKLAKVPLNKIELNYSKIHEGKNVIYVYSNNFKYDTFDVTGVNFVDNTEINDKFIKTVELASTLINEENVDLKNIFMAIKDALKIKNEMSDFTDEKVNDAVKLLDELIAKYKALGTKVNESFKDSVKETHNLIILYGGLSFSNVLGLLFILIFKAL